MLVFFATWTIYTYALEFFSPYILLAFNEMFLWYFVSGNKAGDYVRNVITPPSLVSSLCL